MRACTCAHAFHTKYVVVSARSCAPEVWEREERWAWQGRSLLAGDANDVEVEIACPRCGVHGVLTPAEWMRCVGIAGGPPPRRRTMVGRRDAWDPESTSVIWKQGLKRPCYAPLD